MMIMDNGWMIDSHLSIFYFWLFDLLLFATFYLLGNEDVFTVIFEYCRVSESTLQSILGSLLLNRLSYICQDVRKHVVVSMAQVTVVNNIRSCLRITIAVK